MQNNLFYVSESNFNMLASPNPNCCVPADQHRNTHTYAGYISVHSTSTGKISSQRRFCSWWYHNYNQYSLKFQKSYLAFFILDWLFTVPFLKRKKKKGLSSNKSKPLSIQVPKPKGSYRSCLLWNNMYIILYWMAEWKVQLWKIWIS